MNTHSAFDQGSLGVAASPESKSTRPMVSPVGDCHFGVEVTGVDLRDLTTEDLGWVRQVWSDNPLLLVRRQLLTEDNLMDFSRFFGDLEVVVRKDIHSRHNPEIALVSNLYLEDGSNIGGLGTYELRWHSDQSYRTRPATGAVFYALEIPPEGGNTRWIDMVQAWATLDPEIQRVLEGRMGQFAYQMYNTDITAEPDAKDIRARTPDAEHPLVLTHPKNGQRSLYFDPSQTYAIAGLPHDESDELVRHLSEHVVDPRFIQEHQWHIGDVMLWDNSRLLHSRCAFDPLHPRLAKRTTVFLEPDWFPVPA
ncbi:MAG: TauD/TfdA family dioxygenase [Pseudomonadota bacterium]